MLIVIRFSTHIGSEFRGSGLGMRGTIHYGCRRMGWATPYIEKLKQGDTVQFRPRGNSMTGKIESSQLCTVAPVKVEDLEMGDIVLCKVNGFQYLHLIKAIQGKRFQIGNNRGRINGWIGEEGVYGKCIGIE